MSLSLLCSTAPLLLIDGEDLRTESEVILQAGALLADHPEVSDSPGLTSAVLERQRLSPPLLGNGIALPHARTPLVREIVMSMLRLARPVPFGPEAVPVRLVFLYGIPPHRVTEHLATTAALARKLRDPALVRGLLEAENEEHFRRLLL